MGFLLSQGDLLQLNMGRFARICRTPHQSLKLVPLMMWRYCSAGMSFMIPLRIRVKIIFAPTFVSDPGTGHLIHPCSSMPFSSEPASSRVIFVQDNFIQGHNCQGPGQPIPNLTRLRSSMTKIPTRFCCIQLSL